MNLTGLMPRPFSRFHPQYLSRFRDFKASGKGPSLNIVDNPVGHIVPALHRNGTIFWVRLDVHELPDESGRISLTSKVTIETSAGSEDDARAFVLRLNAPYQGGTDGPSGVGVDGSSGQIELLTGVHPDEILDLPLSKVLRSQTRTDGDLAEFLKTLCGPEEDVPWDIAPFLQAQFLRPDGTAVDVALGRVRAQDAFDPLAPTKLRVQVWVLQRLEGIIEIASDGTVTSASLGALITLGYHDDVRLPFPARPPFHCFLLRPASPAAYAVCGACAGTRRGERQPNHAPGRSEAPRLFPRRGARKAARHKQAHCRRASQGRIASQSRAGGERRRPEPARESGLRGPHLLPLGRAADTAAAEGDGAAAVA